VGPVEGPALVFWPGLNPWGALQLVEVGPLLAERGIHVLACEPPLDLGAPDAYLPTRLAQLIADSAPERFVFMGHSWGGSIGVHLAARHPDRVGGLVLLDGGHVDFPSEQSRDELAARFEADQAGFAFDSWDDWWVWVRTRVSSWRPSLEPRYGEAAMHEVDGQVVPRASARVAAWARWGVHAEPPTSAHPCIECPVLLLLSRSGEEPASLQAEIHRLDAGHDLFEDAPHETVRLVAEWLARLPREG